MPRPSISDYQQRALNLGLTETQATHFSEPSDRNERILNYLKRFLTTTGAEEEKGEEDRKNIKEEQRKMVREKFESFLQLSWNQSMALLLGFSEEYVQNNKEKINTENASYFLTALETEREMDEEFEEITDPIFGFPYDPESLEQEFEEILGFEGLKFLALKNGIKPRYIQFITLDDVGDLLNLDELNETLGDDDPEDKFGKACDDFREKILGRIESSKKGKERERSYSAPYTTTIPAGSSTSHRPLSPPQEPRPQGRR